MFRLPCRFVRRWPPQMSSLRCLSTTSPILEATKITPEPFELRTNDKKTSLRRILTEMTVVKNRMAIAFGLSIFSSSIMMGIPAMTGYIIDGACNGTIDAENILGIGVAVFMFQSSCNWARVYLTNTSGNIYIMKLREKVYSKILHKDIEYFDKNQSGEIVSRLTSDCQVVGHAATTNLNEGFRAIIQFLISTGAIVYIAPTQLIIASIGGIATIILVSRVGGKIIRKYTSEQQHWTAEASRVATERIAAIRTVRAFKQENIEMEKYSEMVQKVQAATEKETRANASLWSINPFMGNLLLIYILKTTVPYLQSGLITSGDVTALLLYATFSGGALAMIGTTYTTLSKAAGAGTRLWNIIDEPQPRIGGTRKIQNMNGGVSIKELDFSYPSRPEDQIFKNLSLDIHPGKTTAIVGHSGSGKSTITKMILQFYQYSRGTIELDGVDLREIDYQWLRENVAIVSQETELFSDTIRANIAYGANHEPTEDEVIDACTRANAVEFINKLEKGLETNIGEGGVLLSGGQRQRIVIARALIRRPKLLILDEATSALDAKSESRVQEAIENLSHEDITLIIIAHRLSTIKNADEIFLLDGGSVAEYGSFNELLHAGGEFTNFVEKQQIR